MRRDDIIRLMHMLDAAREAILFAQGRKRADLDSDRMLVLSLVKAWVAKRDGKTGRSFIADLFPFSAIFAYHLTEYLFTPGRFFWRSFLSPWPSPSGNWPIRRWSPTRESMRSSTDAGELRPARLYDWPNFSGFLPIFG